MYVGKAATRHPQSVKDERSMGGMYNMNFSLHLKRGPAQAPVQEKELMLVFHPSRPPRTGVAGWTRRRLHITCESPKKR